MEQQIERNTGEDAEVDVRNNGEMMITTNDGTMTTGGTVPTDWPSDVPVYANATVQYSATVNESAEGGHMLVLMTPAPQKEVSDYYFAELKKQGWTMGPSMMGDTAVVYSANKENRIVSVQIAASQGQTIITMGVGEQ